MLTTPRRANNEEMRGKIDEGETSFISYFLKNYLIIFSPTPASLLKQNQNLSTESV